jgi:hypothetical protein
MDLVCQTKVTNINYCCRNPRYEEPRARASTLSAPRPSAVSHTTAESPGGRPLPKPRRAMSVSSRDKRPRPLPRLLTRTEEEEADDLPEVDVTYSTPYATETAAAAYRRSSLNRPEPVAHRSRVSSVSSTSSLSSSSTSSCPSSPASPQLAQSLSPEQFWAKYRRHGGPEARKFRGLFASLSLSESAPLVPPAATEPTEPLYSEIYGAVRPPLPRKNSVSKPPARPPLPAEKHPIPDSPAAVATPKKQSSKSHRISVSASPEKEHVVPQVDPTAERPRVRSQTSGSVVRHSGKPPAR